MTPPIFPPRVPPFGVGAPSAESGRLTPSAPGWAGRLSGAGGTFGWSGGDAPRATPASPPPLTSSSAAPSPTPPPPRLPVGDCCILVVDDIETNRLLIGAILAEAGYKNLKFANDGVHALEQIRVESPDIVVLDVMMPRMNGFDVCKALRADSDFVDLPILIQTALSGVSDRNMAFEVGATDLITKPIDRTEFLARVRIHLENRLLIRDLQLYRSRLEGELAMARDIYEHLLPSTAAVASLERALNVTIRSHMLQSSEMGGDIWGAHITKNGCLGVYVLDMAGRGVSAALNACRLHTLVHELIGVGDDDPAGFLTALNQRAGELLALGDQATMIYGVIDVEAQNFTYAAAAASAPLVLPPNSRASFVGDASGAPLGVTSDTRYESRRLPYPKGSVLVLYSNAVLDTLEAVPPERVLLGKGLSAMIAGAVACHAEMNKPGQAFLEVAAALTALVGESPHDDHTLVWISATGGCA
ncbi:phosphoserine phosphatase RsbU/P [Azospirillaceae bacterium]